MVENAPLLLEPSSLMWATVNASLGPDVGSVKLKPSPSATLEETSFPPASPVSYTHLTLPTTPYV